MTIARTTVLLYEQFLVFDLCLLELVTVSLFKIEKIFKFKYYHTVLKIVLDSLNFLHLNVS